MKVLDNSQWIEQQFSLCNLGDKRRTKRLQSVATQMLACPANSLPQQNVEWSDLKAAYRFFACSQTTFEAICQQHWQQTLQTRPGRYLLISDTTDINHFSHKATKGLGMLGDGIGRGIQLHNCLMYDSQKQLIQGAAGGLLYYRKRTPKGETRMQRLKRKRESDLWGEMVDKVGSPPKGSQWIHVFDRGGDNFEAMCHIRLSKCDWVIRASKLKRRISSGDNHVSSLDVALKDARHLGCYDLNLRTRPGMKARTAKVNVSVLKATVPPPIHCSPWVKQCGIRELSMNVVQVKEEGGPKGAKSVCWVLLTSLPVDTFDAAWQVIEDYEHRWLVEEYHKVLKSGCSIEGHSLRTADRLEPLIGLISVIGIRLLQLKLVGRNQPEAKAATHTPSQWLKVLKLAKPKISLTGLTVYQFFRELAKLGGFLARKCDGEPGWQTIWRGYQKLQSLMDGVRLVKAI